MLDGKNEEAVEVMQVWPLAEIRKGEEMMRKARDEPTPLAQKEAAFEEEYYHKRKGKSDEQKCELDKADTQQERLMLIIIYAKGILNRMKAGYREDLSEQQREWEKWKERAKKNEEKEWFQSLTPGQKEASNAERWKHAWGFLSLQNKMLEKWGYELTILSRLLETDFIYKQPLD